MIVQSGYGVLANIVSGKFARPQQGGNVTRSESTEPENTADRVTLSSAGKAFAASEGNAEKTRTAAQMHLVKAASSDPQSADKIARDMAYGSTMIGYDPASLFEKGERRLATTKQLVTDEFKENFQKEAPIIDARRRSLYEAEKAKGTDPLEILNKLIDFDNSQSSSYREATGLGYSFPRN
ncbi:MAG TPA: hypothetical protein VF427_00440 [Noviherbaspirillum sp.]